MWLVFFMLWCLCSADGYSQTYYYRQCKVIKNGVEYKGDNTGQFVTFTATVCYDSDSNGVSVNNGIQKYDRMEKGIRLYTGSSYWGKADYLVKSDYSRINIRLRDSDCIYVYSRVNDDTVLTSHFRNDKQRNASVPTMPFNSNENVWQPDKTNKQVDERWYKNSYARLERVAKNAYDALTHLGYDIKYRNGNREGGTLGTWDDTSSGMQMKQSLKKAQLEMRYLRKEALNNGVRIEQSVWERATVD